MDKKYLKKLFKVFRKYVIIKYRDNLYAEGIDRIEI